MKKRAFLFIIIAGVLWGTSVIFVKILAPYGLTSLQMTFMRALISFVSFAIFALLRNRKLFRANKKELLLFAMTGISFFGTATCYYFSMQETSPSTAVVLMYLAPIIVMIYSVIFLGEKFTALKAISLFAMLIGCALVSGIVGGLAFRPLGIAIGVLSGICYAVYNIFTKIGTRQKCEPVSITLYCFLFAAIVSFFVCSPEKIPQIISENGFYIVLLIVAMGIATCVLPYLFYTMGMKDLPAGTASALGIIEPMAATIFSVTLFGEELGIYPLIGIVLILSAVFALNKT